MKNYADTDAYRTHLKQFDAVFSQAYLVKKDTIQLTKQLTLYIEHFERRDCNQLTACQVVCLKDKHAGTILTYKNIGYLFHQYIQHSNGNTYFIAGSALYDYILFDIRERTMRRYVGAQVLQGVCSGEATPNLYWYLENLVYNPVSNLIAINGSDIVNCSRIAVFDFSNTQLFPFVFYSLSDLIFQYDEGENHTAIGWTPDNCLEVQVAEEMCNTLYLTEKEIRNQMN